MLPAPTYTPQAYSTARTFFVLLIAGLYLGLSGCSDSNSFPTTDTQAECVAQPGNPSDISLDSLALANEWPTNLDITYFAGPEITPSPAVLATAHTGEVFVGVDMMGSLGKDPGKGHIVRLSDCNNDGIVDAKSIFAVVDNPRGILPLGDQLFVLHTVFSEETGLADGMDLIVFEDKDRDGVADGPPSPLIEHISNVNFLRQRGTDHSTNNIRMGIDGWIYIAVGDFGFHEAIDRSGNALTMLGGGILRVRPDGTEMEEYTHGLRNIYDVAIDPYLNIFTRGNTNDGGGWNMRFIHQVQSGEYGYPVLFRNFTEEIIPALVDVGGGSGTGALFMDNPSWPEEYTNVPMMADWGRNMIYIHRVTPDGPSFLQEEEAFLQVPQVTDLDVDASGRMYIAAWDGAGFRGDSSKGFVLRAVPNDWDYQRFPDLEVLNNRQLTRVINIGGAEARLYAQQELIRRQTDEATESLKQLATNKRLPLPVRITGLFGYAQAAGAAGIDALVRLSEEDDMREFALRALADRKSIRDNVPIQPFIEGLTDPSARVQVAAAVGLGRLGRIEAAEPLLQVPMPPAFATPARGTEGPHATPNAPTILPHVAVRSLVSLNAVETSVDALDTPQADVALWALRYMHSPDAVQGLIGAYEATQEASLKRKILVTLARIYHEEAPYDGSWWWGTRPDTRGPYYKPIPWESTEMIRTFFLREWGSADREGQLFFTDLNAKHRLDIPEFGMDEALAENQEPEMDLSEITNKRGQIGRSSIEDIMLAMVEIEPDTSLGRQLFTSQGCEVCHNLKQEDVMKGPYMGQIGAILTRDQIAESILTPNASISQGFATVLIATTEGESYVGFITEETADIIKVRNIAGQVFTINAEDVASRKIIDNSMMPEGLTNSLSYKEFTALVTFLSLQQ